jgi:hypothetical protein
MAELAQTLRANVRSGWPLAKWPPVTLQHRSADLAQHLVPEQSDIGVQLAKPGISERRRVILFDLGSRVFWA